jgi:phosphoenolpyruvate-protein kinase (PTS system EI component)
MTAILLGLELDELSVSPGLVPKIKKVIRESKFADCHALVTDVMKDPSSRQRPKSSSPVS